MRKCNFDWKKSKSDRETGKVVEIRRRRERETIFSKLPYPAEVKLQGKSI
jgi:hypothetical protein